MNTKITKEDVEMAQYIIYILKSKRIITMSWGFNSPTIITDGLQFNVQGFIHTGLVQVIYVHGVDLFKIRLLLNENELLKEIEQVYFDELVEIIDNYVEKVNNYNGRVKSEYPNLNLHSN